MLANRALRVAHHRQDREVRLARAAPALEREPVQRDLGHERVPDLAGFGAEVVGARAGRRSRAAREMDSSTFSSGSSQGKSTEPSPGGSAK